MAWMSEPSPEFAAKVEQTASSNQILIDALWAAWQAGYQDGQKDKTSSADAALIAFPLSTNEEI